jgi:predicted nuclease of predicted toxin-antitoxin system
MGALAFLMRLYLDDDSIRSVLIRRLTADGHDVLIPSDAGIAGEEDATHLMCAIRTDRILVTHNHDDFELLHDLVVLAGGHHPGILVIRRDNDPTRDMSPGAIVGALNNLVKSEVGMADSFSILNHWR